MKLALYLVLMIPTVLWSQETSGPKGNHDLSIYVSPDFEGVTGDTLDLAAGYGYYFFDRLALRAAFDLATVEDIAPGEKDYRFREIDAGLQYDLGRWRAVLAYVGVSLGLASLTYLDFHDSSFVYGPDAGLEYFFTEKVAIDFAVSFRNASKNVFVNDFILEDSDLTSSIGLRVRF